MIDEPDPDGVVRVSGNGQKVVWVDHKGRPWVLHFRFGTVEGRVEVVGVEVRSVRRRGEVWLADLLPPDVDLQVRGALGKDKSSREGANADEVAWWVDSGDPEEGEAEDVSGRDPSPLTAEVWRQIKPGALIERVRAATIYKVDEAGGFQGNLEAERTWLGPRNRIRTHLGRVAALYLAAPTSARTRYVAEQMHISYATARNRVYRARQAGLLPPTGKGRGTRPPAYHANTEEK